MNDSSVSVKNPGVFFEGAKSKTWCIQHQSHIKDCFSKHHESPVDEEHLVLPCRHVVPWKAGEVVCLCGKRYVVSINRSEVAVQEKK